VVALRVAGMPCETLAGAVTWHAANIRPMPNRRPKVEPSRGDAFERGAVDKLPAMADAPEPVPPGASDRYSTYSQARTAREVYAAKLAQLEYEQSVGRLVNADAVRSEFAKQIVGVRDQFLRLPDRLAPMLVGLDDIAAIKRIIMAEVRMALTQFAGKDDAKPVR
jgi:hypothetical protein